MRFQPRRSRGIFFGLRRMLSAVHFHDQSMLQTTEIHDVIAYCMLAAKLCAIEAFGAEVLPEHILGWSLFATEAADIGTYLFWCAHNNRLYCKL